MLSKLAIGAVAGVAAVKGVNYLKKRSAQKKREQQGYWERIDSLWNYFLKRF